jgi:hypothetical protein
MAAHVLKFTKTADGRAMMKRIGIANWPLPDHTHYFYYVTLIKVYRMEE